MIRNRYILFKKYIYYLNFNEENFITIKKDK